MTEKQTYIHTNKQTNKQLKGEEETMKYLFLFSKIRRRKTDQHKAFRVSAIIRLESIETERETETKE